MKNHGIVRIQVCGLKKWTALRRPGNGFPWGKGYTDTREQAVAKARALLKQIQDAEMRAENFTREYRIA